MNTRARTKVMLSRTRILIKPGLVAVCVVALGLPLSAQQIQRTNNEEGAPAAPAAAAAPLTLDACIALGMQQQPSLDAARASLSAAQTGSSALNKLIIPRLFVPDLPVRR